MAHVHDEDAMRKNLKVFIGSLPPHVQEHDVGNHFAKYGHISDVKVCNPPDKTPYAFATFRFAADADCAVVDRNSFFPGMNGRLALRFATPPGAQMDRRKYSEYDYDPCKVFVGGITDTDNEEQVGDFFSQWGLVTIVYRTPTYGYVSFATKEAAQRLMDEGSVMFQSKQLDIRPSDRKTEMSYADREDLVQRAIARHFHKKGRSAQPPPGGHHPPPHGGVPPSSHYPPLGPRDHPPHYPPHSAPPHGGPPPGGPPPSHGPPNFPPPGGHYPNNRRQSGSYPPHSSVPPSHPPPGSHHGHDPYAQPHHDPYDRPPRDPYGPAPTHGHHGNRRGENRQHGGGYRQPVHDHLPQRGYDPYAQPGRDYRHHPY